MLKWLPGRRDTLNITMCFHTYRRTWADSLLFFPPSDLPQKTKSDKVWRTQTNCTLVFLTSSCQFSLNHTIWSTMPSREESSVGCNSRCMCMILLQRHMGAVALMGPGSEAPEWDWAPTELGCCCPDASGQRGDRMRGCQDQFSAEKVETEFSIQASIAVNDSQ